MTKEDIEREYGTPAPDARLLEQNLELLVAGHTAKGTIQALTRTLLRTIRRCYTPAERQIIINNLFKKNYD